MLGTWILKSIDTLLAVNEFANDPDGDHVVKDVIFNVVVVPLTDCTILITSISVQSEITRNWVPLILNVVLVVPTWM